MNEKESKTWWEINQFDFGLVKFDSPVGYIDGKVAQTTAYIFGTQSSSDKDFENISIYVEAKTKRVGSDFQVGYIE